MAVDQNLPALLNERAELSTLEFVEKFFDFYVWMPPRDRMAVALWTMHMHVYNQFRITPRLAILSPTAEYGWGKTTLLDIIRHLAPSPMPRLIIDPSPPGLYQSVDNGATALLLDEVDNLSLKTNSKLRQILNANVKGYAIPRGGSATKKDPQAKPKLFEPFIPIAVAAVGRLPEALTTRSIAIHMRLKPDGVFRENIDDNPEQFSLLTATMRTLIARWANNIVLPHQVDTGLDNRFADNWKPLIAIADYFEQADKARSMARAMTGAAREHSEGTQLLIHIRVIFDTLGVDRIARETLLTELYKFDAWNEWGRCRNFSKPTRSRSVAAVRNLPGSYKRSTKNTGGWRRS
jgi:hypothetical protein